MSPKPRDEDRGARTASMRPGEIGRSVAPPEVIVGRYLVESRVGTGAMGDVLLAMDTETGRRVAVKRVDAARLGTRGAALRLLRGARAAAALQGAHAVRVLGHGMIEGGGPFFVTEYLEGCDLAAYVARRGPLRVKEAVKYLLQVCEAVAEAHAAGMIHRDLKPQNVFISLEALPSVKVMEFGTSAVACGAEADGGAAAPRAMRASLLTMAPEQMRSGGNVDARADVWSIGAIGYLLVCGNGPFEAETDLEICAKVMREPPAPIPRALDLGGLDKALLRCLAKDPEERYASVAELAAELAGFGGEGSARAADRVRDVLATPRADVVEALAGDGFGAAPDEVPELPDLLGLEGLPPSIPPPSLESTARVDALARAEPHADAVDVLARAELHADAIGEHGGVASPGAGARVVEALRSGPPSARAPRPPSARAPRPPLRSLAARLRRPLEIAAASLAVAGLLVIWLIRGRVIALGGGHAEVVRTGIAEAAIRVIRVGASTRARAADARPAPRLLPGTPPAAPSPALVADDPRAPPIAASAEPLTPPPGGWQYPSDVIYEQVERERRLAREREQAARRAPPR